MKTTGMVPARAFFLCAAGFALATFTPERAEATIACKDLHLHTLSINANGSTGWISWGVATETSPGSGSFSATGHATFPGGPAGGDPVTATCKGRHLTFTRTRSGVFTQIYSGWMYSATNSLAIAGDFSHNSTEKTYGWCGSFELPPPS
jgi:hypothetical protein